jgi:hypothetical protein
MIFYVLTLLAIRVFVDRVFENFNHGADAVLAFLPMRKPGVIRHLLSFNLPRLPF